MRIPYRALPLPLVLLLSVQLLGVSARLEEGDSELPSSQLLTRADTYLATGRGSDALELYDIVAGRDKSSYVSYMVQRNCSFVDVAAQTGNPVLALSKEWSLLMAVSNTLHSLTFTSVELLI